MSSVNLDTYSLSLLAAKEDILNSKCSTNWAVFTYEKRNDLKLSDSGAGGLEELAGKFTDNSLLYALCQVKDANTGQLRIILINWAGEKVDEVYRQTCAAHLPAIKAFFKEASVVLTARHADEVTSDAIHNVLASLSLAGSTSRKPRAMDSEELVGTNYRKTNPALEMRRTNRDSFWAQAEREEEERKEEERRRLQEERKRWDRERMEQEKKDAEERDRRIKEKEHLIEEQRKEQARIQAEERKTEKSKWEQQQKEHEEEMRDRFRRSESIEKAAEAAVLVSQRSLNPRDFFRQREHSFSSSRSPTSPPAGGTRRPALRYQRSLTESAFIFRKSESSTSTPPSPSPSYARRNEFFSSTSPRSPPETCSPSLIFSKAGAPTRPGRFPMASPPRAGSHPHKIFSRADSLPAANLTHYGSLRSTSPPNIREGSPTSLARPKPLSPASLPRSENPAPASPPREEPIPCPSPPKVEPTPPASLPKDESSLSLPRYESPLPDSPPTVECLPLTSSLGAESPQSSSPPRAASPPTVSSPTVEPALSSSSDRANSPFSAISTKYETVPEESTPRVEQTLPASPPRAVSPSLVTISNETLVSLESTPNEDSVLRETMHHVESVVVESQHVTESLPIENQPNYDSAPDETSLRLETQSPGLPTMSVDVLEASAAHVAFTEEAQQGELIASKDPPSFNSDINSISAMLHSLPHYTPLETEWGASNSLQLEDISAAPSYRHGEDSEPDEAAPLGSQGPDVPHTSQESQVNGARHNGIGGQEDEEGLQEEMPEEEEAEPGSTPKACVRAVYEYHAEDGTRLSLEHNDLMPVPESQNEA